MKYDIQLPLIFILLNLSFPIITGRIYKDKEVAARIPVEVKDQIDKLLQQKLRLYMSTYFGEEDEFSISSTDGGAVMAPNILENHSRSRRGINEASNTSGSTINGGYSEWTAFGPCSSSCGGGMQQRIRTCTNPLPQNNGSDCTHLGPSIETRYCNIVPCIAEQYTLKRISLISTIQTAVTLEIKHFKIGSDHYIGALSFFSLQIFKWEPENRKFIQHNKAIPVFNARSFDIFDYIVDKYIILAEKIENPNDKELFTRILSYNDVTKTFDFRKQIMLPLPDASKVVAFNVFGQPHAAFIQFQSKAAGHEITTTVCDTRSQTINCGLGATITIQSAFYGRSSWSICSYGWFFNIRTCSAQGILDNIAKTCNNQTQCTLEAPPVGITDPCPVFTKYLTVTYTCDKKMFKNVPRFYVWERVSFQVIPSDSLVTYGAKDIEAFTLHHKHFIVVANFINDEGSHHIDSEVFIYSSNLKRFQSFQKLRTDAAVDWEFFSIGKGLATEYFLAVANQFKLDKDGNKQLLIDSVIYKWNWNLFVPFQCIKTNGARKWTAVKGDHEQFLLVLSSDKNENGTVYEYDGWRFYLRDVRPESTLLYNDASVSYSFKIANETMLLVNYDVAANATRPSGNLHVVEFEKAFPRFRLLNHTLSRIDKINQTIEKLTTRMDNINNTYQRNKNRMVFLTGNQTIEGEKNFSNIEVRGDIKTVNASLDAVLLSATDKDIIDRQQKVEEILAKQKYLLNKLQNMTKRLMSKTRDQIIKVPYSFKNFTKIERMEAISVNVSGTINGVDLDKLAVNALYTDQNQTILGNKSFADNLVFYGNLIVKGNVDGVNASDIVTLSSEQIITGRKTIIGDVTFTSSNGEVKNIEIKGLLNGINVSRNELLTVREAQNITGSYTFTEDVHVKKNFVVDTVNNFNLTDIYIDAVLLNTTQNISGSKIFKEALRIDGNLDLSPGKTVDKVDVSEIENNVLSRTKDQNISGSVEFGSDVVFHNTLQVNGLINGINISKDIVFLSKEQTITGEKTFLNNVTFHRNMNVDGLVNGVNISGDLLTINGTQKVTGHKTFQADVSVHGNIIMEEGKTVDGVDLSELANEAVYKHLPQVITGDKTFTNIKVVNVTVSCNNSCHLVNLLKNLSERTVKRSKPAVISGMKTFANDVYVGQNVTVNGFVNGIKVPEDLVLKNKPQTIRGKKTFLKQIYVAGDATIVGYLNGVNISEMYRKAVLLRGDQVIAGEKTFQHKIFVKGNMSLNGTLNGLKVPSDLVSVHGDETIDAHKVFKGPLTIDQLSVDKMEVEGLIDNVNITELNRTIIRKNGNQVIEGDVTFQDGFSVAGDLVSPGTINGINITDLYVNSLKINGDQIVTGKKIFTKPVNVTDSLTVDGLIDGVNLTDLNANIVTLDGNQTISGEIHFMSNVEMEGNMVVDGLVNGINTTKLEIEALRLTGNQTITGKYNFSDLTVNGDIDIDGEVNGIDLSEDAVTLSGNETLEGKTFTDDVIVHGHLIVDGLIDEVNLTKLHQEAVFLHDVQEVWAEKRFLDDIYIMGNLTVNGLINNVNVTELNLTAFTKDTNQIISGKFSFINNVNFTNTTTLAGFINGINLTEFNRDVVTKSTPQTITGKKTFHLVTVYGHVKARNINITGKINEVDLSKLDKKAVRIYGDHLITGAKTFVTETTFEKDLLVNSTINGLRFPDDIVRLSINQTIRGEKKFEQDLIILGNLDADTAVLVDGVDVSELAANAVYVNANQSVHGPVQFNNITFLRNIIMTSLINGVNISKEHLLLKTGKQIVTGEKKFTNLIIKGNVNLNGTINGVDVLKLNKTSMFANRNNIVLAKKTIIGNLIVAGNLTTRRIDGVDPSHLHRQYIESERVIKAALARLSSAIARQQGAVNGYIKSVQNLHPKLDFFITEQTLTLPYTAISFDAIRFEDQIFMIVLDNQRNFNSTIYKKNSSLETFIPFEKIAVDRGSDVKMFEQDSKIHAAVASRFSIYDPDVHLEKSAIYTLDSKTLKTQAKRYLTTNMALHAHAARFDNDTLVTFSSTFNPTTNQICVPATPVMFDPSVGFKTLGSILGCGIQKIITRQIDSHNFLLVMLASGLYDSREALIYKVNTNGTSSVLQRLPTFFATDALFLDVDSTLFLVIANQYQKSQVSLLIEYNVPVQIYRFNSTLSQFIWYQDLSASGAKLLSSFSIDRYSYLTISTIFQEVKVFQFMGCGKFSKVDSMLSQGSNNIKQMRSWRFKGDVFVGLMSAVIYPSPQTYLRIYKAIKTASTSAAEINKKLDSL